MKTANSRYDHIGPVLGYLKRQPLVVLLMHGALLMASMHTLAQKVFSFDYHISYRNTDFRDSTRILEHFLTNSKDNSFWAELREIDASHSQLRFYQHNGFRFDVQFKTNDFRQADTLRLPCNQVKRNRDRSRRKVKNYEFVLLAKKEEEESAAHYRLRSTRTQKEREKRNIGHLDYWIQESTDFHLPVLIHPTAFQKWKTEGYLPKGIFKKRTYSNALGKKEQEYTLIGYSKTHQNILFSLPCTSD